MQAKDTREGAAHDRRRATGIVHRLLQRVMPAAAVATTDDSAFGELQPPGHRSGQGAASLAPYLDQFRSTKPASLD